MFKGIQKDNHENLFQEGEYSYAENIVLTENIGSITNERGSMLIDTISKLSPLENTVIIGHIQDKNTFILFVKRDEASEIWVLYEDKLNQVNLNGIDLTFNLAHPIKGQFYRNFKGEMVISFTDDYNKPKVLNIGVIETPPLQVQENDLRDTLMFPEAQYGSITGAINVGGGLRTGSHQIALRYVNIDNSYTNFVNYSEIFYVGNTTNGDSAFSPSDLNSNNRLELTISNVDTTYTYFELVHIQYINNVFEAQLLPKQYITGTTMNVDVLGTETFTSISYEEVIVPTVNYIKARTISQLNNSLYIGNVQEETEFDYQPYANLITSTWNSEAVDLYDQFSSGARTVHQGFAHGEVYAFYISFIKLDGTLTRAFHIPSRAIDNSERASITVGDVTAKKYQVDDTSTLLTSVANTSANGTFNAWENENEVYPNEDSYNSTAFGGEDLRGQKVRHHHFPNMRWLQQNVYTDYKYGRRVLDKLGVTFSNIVIPPTLADKVQGYKILYAKRTFANTRNYGNFLYHPSARWDGNTPAIYNWTTGGNWDTWFQLSGGGGVGDSFGVTDYTTSPFTRKLRVNNIDLYLNQPEIPNCYVRPEVVVECNAINKYQADNAGGCDGCNGGRLLDFVGQYTFTSFSIATSDYAKQVVSTRYIPYNTIGANPTANNYDAYNKYTEAHLQLGLPIDSTFTSSFALSATKQLDPPYLFRIDDGGNVVVGDRNITALMTLMSLKTDVYSSFLSQTLLDTDAQGVSVTSTTYFSTTFKGDVWVTQQSHNTYSPRRDIDNDFQNYYTNHFRWVGESINNGAFKYEAPNKYSRFFPYTNVEANQWTLDFPLDGDPNAYAYDRSFSLLEPSLTTPFNPILDFTGKYPYRVVKSLPNQEEQREQGWKTWLANEYYEMPKEKGYITNLQAYGKQLLIHHQNTLYRTIGATQITTDDVTATLGTADIFSVTPEEVVAIPNGFGGTEHQFGVMVAKAGYGFVDAKQGKVFLYNGELQEISNEGLRTFFYNHLQLLETTPIIHTGIELKLTQWCKGDDDNTIWYVIPKVSSFYRVVDNQVQEIVIDVIPPSDTEYFNDVYSTFYYYKEIPSTGDIITCKGIERKQNIIHEDNPYYGAGYSMAWDELHQRVLLSKIVNDKTVVVEGEPVLSKSAEINTRVVYNNIVKKVTQVGGIELLSITSGVYGGSTRTVLTFDSDAGLDIGYEFSIVNGSFAGTYIVYDILSVTQYVINTLETVGVAPFGYLENTGSITTEYWDGTTYGLTPTNYNTIGSPASGVVGATEYIINYQGIQSQDVTSNACSVLYNGDWFWSDGTTTYYYGVVPTELFPPLKPTTIKHNYFLYYNGTCYQTTPIENPDTVVQEAVFYLPTDYVIKGAFRNEDQNFVGCLSVGDIVIIDDTYKKVC